MKDRDQVLDVAKGIAIILVVVGHIYLGENKYAYYLKTFLYSFHLPLFFMVSGLLFKPEKVNTTYIFFKSRFNGLIYPYITFSIIAYLIWIAFEVMQGGGSIATLLFDPIYIWALGLRGGDNYVFTGAYWFLVCLFMTELCFYFIYKYLTKSIALISLIAFLILLISYSFSKFGIVFPLPFSIDLLPIGLFFFITGFVLKNSYSYFRIIGTSIDFRLISICLIAVTVMYLGLKNGAVDMYSNKFGKFPMIFLITGFLGSIMVILISTFIKESKILNYFGQGSLIVLLVHQQIVIHPLNCIFWPFDKTGKELFYLILIYYVTIFSFCIFFIKVIPRKLPFLIRPK